MCVIFETILKLVLKLILKLYMESMTVMKKNVEKYVYEVEKLNYKFSFVLLWILAEIIK